MSQLKVDTITDELGTGAPSFPNGNVGIGTTTPTSKLNIVTDSLTTGFKITSSNDWGNVSSPMVDFDGNAGSTGDGNILRVKTGAARSDVEILDVVNGNGSVFTVKGNGYVMMPYQPSCLIACQGPDINWSSGNLIGYGTSGSIKVFDTTNSFNMSTYRYTAPIAGKYYIACTANGVDTGTVPRASVRINGSNVGNNIHLRGNNEGGGDLDQRTFAAIYHLNLNDYVDVYVFAGTFDTFGANYFSAHYLG